MTKPGALIGAVGMFGALEPGDALNLVRANCKKIAMVPRKVVVLGVILQATG